MSDVRLATKADLPAVGEALAKAFDDDPFVEYLLPQASRNRPRRMAAFMGMAADGALELGSLYTTPDRVGAAAWRPPKRWKLETGEMLRSTPTLFRALGRNIPRTLRVLNLVEKHHPTEEHWYLEVLGTEPGHQGKGVGSSLMQPVLDRCDEEGLGAYLESSKEKNVPFYRRHGFEVTEELTFPNGPTIWLMWRDPQR